ncbi:glutamine-hydrolyzing carbamoyl-phosphate synthase small subunit [Halothermothrix orenii]|uniref:Carbamoyl phosphate synthase small chain n=1 Tax=Halothermothrix orenii (strain H 168 / OCM 544 / DSM 9562) TaxID=373903 RepID=B8D1H2_HALOH|nr:carbamoyl-phosphate synthase, small subunit [Halothermothrix orenii H 168]
MEAKLVLEDGTVFKGKGLGYEGTTWGEVVFNTSMTGYQEILTDPSYRGQLVTLTYPLIGNYGINHNDFESYEIHAGGLIIREDCSRPNHWQSQNTLDVFLKEYKITGITNIDTRALTRRLRSKGSMFGVISSEILDEKELNKIIKQKIKEKRCLVEEVSVSTPTRIPGKGPRVVVMDFGVKYNIVRYLKSLGADIFVLPYSSSAEEVLSYNPDGILLSNGPGDPMDISEKVPEIQSLATKNIPVFGICLGHQLLGLAFGGRTYKLKFGHHGGNHPVKDLRTGKVLITTQNHGYALEDGLPPEIEVTHINLNDGTIEGIKHKDLPVSSVQYHPEAGPGPKDSTLLFNEFINKLTGQRNVKKLVNF